MENYENSIDASKIEIEEVEWIMVSDDSIFNHFNTNDKNYSSVIEDVIRKSEKSRKMRKSNTYLTSVQNEKENFTVLNNITNLNNISKISDISINNGWESSNSNSEKTKLQIKNRRFERRPNYSVNKSNSSSKQLSSLPDTYSYNKLPSNENKNLKVDQKGIHRVKNEMKNSFHDRHMSNPANFVSPLNLQK